MFRITLLQLQFYAVLVFCYTKPENPCAMDDSKCLTKVFADLWAMAIAGDPKSGIAKLDPMHHDVINADLMSVRFTLRDVTVTGFKDSRLLSGGISHPKLVYGIVHLPHYEMSGKYQCDGTFLNTTVKGNGNFTLKGSNIKMRIEIIKKFFKSETDGKIHSQIPGFQFIAEDLGKVHLKADNMFGGNKKLGKAALKLINENDKIFSMVWGPPVTTANLNQIFGNLNKFLVNVYVLDNVQYVVKDII